MSEKAVLTINSLIVAARSFTAIRKRCCQQLLMLVTDCRCSVVVATSTTVSGNNTSALHEQRADGVRVHLLH